MGVLYIERCETYCEKITAMLEDASTTHPNAGQTTLNFDDEPPF